MARVFEILTGQTLPTIDAVLKEQGVGENYTVTDVIKDVYEQAVELYRKTVLVQGIYDFISAPEFSGLYAGEGQNDSETPVADLCLRSERLSLFAVTLGRDVSDKISELMQSGEYALGVMLDATASQGAEKAADELEKIYLSDNPEIDTRLKVLRYSPGYCGWHVSGQKKLFSRLHPENIGISLNDRCLMNPLKSISGVLIAAEKEKHYFDMTYACCEACDSFACRERLAGLEDV